MGRSTNVSPDRFVLFVWLCNSPSSRNCRTLKGSSVFEPYKRRWETRVSENYLDRFWNESTSPAFVEKFQRLPTGSCFRTARKRQPAAMENCELRDFRAANSRSVTKQNNDALFLVPARFLSIRIGPLDSAITGKLFDLFHRLESISRTSPLKSYRFQLYHFSLLPYLNLVIPDRWKSKFPRRFRSRNVVFSRSHVEDTRRPDRQIVCLRKRSDGQ